MILVPQHQFYMGELRVKFVSTLVLTNESPLIFQDETLTEKELHRKMLFIGIIGLLAFATLLCYAFAKSAWRI